jgi:hypothetical protein
MVYDLAHFQTLREPYHVCLALSKKASARAPGISKSYQGKGDV